MIQLFVPPTLASLISQTLSATHRISPLKQDIPPSEGIFTWSGSTSPSSYMDPQCTTSSSSTDELSYMTHDGFLLPTSLCTKFSSASSSCISFRIRQQFRSQSDWQDAVSFLAHLTLPSRDKEVSFMPANLNPDEGHVISRSQAVLLWAYPLF